MNTYLAHGECCVLVSAVPWPGMVELWGTTALPERGGDDVGETVDGAVLVRENSADETARDSDELVGVLGVVET